MKFFQSLHFKHGVMEVLGKEHYIRLNHYGVYKGRTIR